VPGEGWANCSQEGETLATQANHSVDAFLQEENACTLTAHVFRSHFGSSPFRWHVNSFGNRSGAMLGAQAQTQAKAIH